MKLLHSKFGGSFLLLCIITTVLYLPHFSNPFQFDDAHTIQTNAAIHSLRNIPLFFVDASTNSSMPENCAYRPVQSTMDAIDWAIGKGATWSFHLHIFFWFLMLGGAVAGLSYKLLVAHQLISVHSYFWPFMVAFIVLLHPMSAETINYICARSDGFSALCMVLTLGLIIPPPVRLKWLWVIPFLIGILTKQSALMVAPLAVIYLLWVSPAPRLHLKKAALILALSVVGYVFIQHIMTPPTTASVNTGISPWLYFMNQTRVVLFYLQQFFVPNALHADPHFDILPATSPLLIGSLCILMALTAGAIALKKVPGGGLVTFGWFWYILGLAPTSSFIPLFQMANFHRPFFSNIGLALAGMALVCMLIRAFASHAKTIRAVAIGLLLLFLGTSAVLTLQRHKTWKSDELLWLEVTQHSPNNGRAWLNLGRAKMQSGHWNEAETLFLKAASLLPNWPYVHINLGVLYQNQQKPTQAELSFLKALAFAGNNGEPYLWYARFLITQHRLEEAEQHISAGLVLSPRHQGLLALKQKIILLLSDSNAQADAFIVKSLQAYEQANYSLMIAYCRQALALKPNYSVAYNNICSAYIQLEQLDSAAWYCQKAIQADSNNMYAKQNYQWILNNQK